jgi:hypothetical protein
VGEGDAEQEADRRSERETHGCLFGREERGVPEHLDQHRPIPPRRLEELADDVVEVRQRPVADNEGTELQPRGLAEPLERLPEAAQHGEDEREHPEPSEGRHRHPPMLTTF